MAIKIADHVRAVIDEDGAILLDVRKGKYYSLNGIAGDIWKQLESGSSLAAIEEYLARTYDGSGETLRQDLADFIGSLTEQHLVHGED